MDAGGDTPCAPCIGSSCGSVRPQGGRSTQACPKSRTGRSIRHDGWTRTCWRHTGIREAAGKHASARCCASTCQSRGNEERERSRRLTLRLAERGRTEPTPARNGTTDRLLEAAGSLRYSKSDGIHGQVVTNVRYGDGRRRVQIAGNSARKTTLGGPGRYWNISAAGRPGCNGAAGGPGNAGCCCRTGDAGPP